MSASRSYYRWWYPFLLLPLLIYGGARWYVSHRIDGLIAEANRDGNVLAVENYSFGFFPARFTLNGVTFNQQTRAFSGIGGLGHLEVSGIDLSSLFGDGPIRLHEIHLRGLEAELERKAVMADATDKRPFLIDKLSLDSIFISATDGRDGSMLRLADLKLSLSSLRFPFQPERIEALAVSTDSLLYLRPSDSSRLLAWNIDYPAGGQSLRLRSLEFVKGDGIELTAKRILVSGLKVAELNKNISLDSLRIDSLGGGARVQNGSGKTAQDVGDYTLTLGHLHLPSVDIKMAGELREGDFQGSIEGEGVSFGSRNSLDLLYVKGDTISYRDNDGLKISGRNLKFLQRDLKFPLRIPPQGETEIDVESLMVELQGKLYGTLNALAYRSETEEISTAGIEFTTDNTNGKVAGISVQHFVRDSMLAASLPLAEAVTLEGFEISVNKPGGGRYDIAAPEAVITGITGGADAKIHRVRIKGAALKRWGQDGVEDIVAQDIYLDQYGLNFPVKLQNMGPVTATAGEIQIRSSTQPVDYHIWELNYDSRAGLLKLDSLNRVNRYRAEELFENKIAKSWLSFCFEGLRMSGIDHAALMSGNMIAADSLLTEDLRLMVVEDISLELPPKDKPMPIEALRKIGPRIVLKGGRLASTDIAYGVVDTVLQPKTIHFSAGTIGIENLDTENSSTDSVSLSMLATFEGSAKVNAVFRLSRDSSGRNFAARGELTSYDLSGVNPLMEVAADAIVESGVIDKLAYQSNFRDGVVTGDMQLLYHDLDLKSVGSGAWIKNLLAGMLLKKENVAGDSFRQGRIFHEHSPHKSFFNAYWKGLVSGMRSTALSDIALQKELD